MAPETAIGGAILIALTLYALGAGADFGGGVWDLLARGPRAQAQRDCIAAAIGPVWEANHVWLILVVVLLFVCFPLAFAAIGTALHVPLSLMLIGIVLRGSAFAFRTYDRSGNAAQRRWGRVFAIASVGTPITLGVCVGAVVSGRIRVDRATGAVPTDFVSAWLAPFPIALGLFTLALFAFLAAVYLTLETDDAALRRDFRARALAAAAASGVLAFACLALARGGAPLVHEGLMRRGWSAPFQLATGAAALGAIVALVRERYGRARVLAIVQVALVVWGWGLTQYPYVVAPDLTLQNAAAPPAVLRPVLIALGAGAVVLFPSLALLFRVFKRPGRPAGRMDHATPGGVRPRG